MTPTTRLHAVTAEIETPIGPMIAAASDSHLLLFEFPHRRMIDTQLDRVRRAHDCELAPGESPIFATLRAQLDEYFHGDRREFSLPLDVPGTPFQTRVWSALLRIPCGTTTSYARLAESIGQPNAVRAVARANGDNRIAIIIPCHRVIGSTGDLVGYGGGVWRKKKLLDLEARAEALSLF
ncbi:MAG TPA: methylated-DNA--[protein]-cysteine S-methyltransferase [Gemmatimonadaceae bacterium]|jgi:AraC family transcriptional regulator of adaptative response/methylated-DNA-[protein]-cysteine methyltransferase